MSVIAGLMVEFGADYSAILSATSAVRSLMASTASLASSALSTMASAVTAPSRAMESLGETISGVGGAISTLGRDLKMATADLENYGQQAIQLAGDLEQSTIAFETLTGSAGEAEKMLGKIRDLADVSPFNFMGLQRTSKQLLAVGVEADELIPTLTAVGDAVGAIGGSNAMIDRVVHNFAQMRAQGVLTNRDLRDLASTGLPIYDILAEKLGVDVSQALAMVASKSITAADGLALLTEGFSERFGGAMERQSASYQGLMSTLQDTTENAMTHIGQTIIDTLDLKGWAKQGIAGIGELTAWFDALDPSIKEVAVSIAASAIGMAHVLPYVGQLVSGVGSLVSGFGFLLSPIGLITTAVTALASAFIYLAATDETFMADLMEIWDALGVAAERIFGMIGINVTTVGATISSSITSALDFIATKMGKWLPDILATIDALPDHFEQIKTYIETEWVPALASAWESVKWAFRMVWDSIKALIAGDTQGFEAALTAVAQKIGDGLAVIVVATIRSVVTGILPALAGELESAFQSIADSISAKLGLSKSGYSYEDTVPQDHVTRASGGLVTGPGSGMSDSIPAMLSNGEYVINAASASRIGLSSLNSLNRYATGGSVGTVPAVAVPDKTTEDPDSALIVELADFTKQIKAMDDEIADARKVGDLSGWAKTLGGMKTSMELVTSVDWIKQFQDSFGDRPVAQMFPHLDAALSQGILQRMDASLGPFLINASADFATMNDHRRANIKYVEQLDAMASGTSLAAQAMANFQAQMNAGTFSAVAGMRSLGSIFEQGAAARAAVEQAQLDATVAMLASGDEAATASQTATRGLGATGASAVGLAGTLSGVSNIIGSGFGIRPTSASAETAAAIAAAGLGDAAYDPRRISTSSNVIGSMGGKIGSTASSTSTASRLGGVGVGGFSGSGGAGRGGSATIINLVVDGQTIASVMQPYQDRNARDNL